MTQKTSVFSFSMKKNHELRERNHSVLGASSFVCFPWQAQMKREYILFFFEEFYIRSKKYILLEFEKNNYSES